MAAQNPITQRREPILHVHLYDQANVPRQTLDRAIEETVEILASAGVQSVFEPSDANSPESQTLDMTAPTLGQTPDVREFLVARIVRGGLPATVLPRMLGYSFPWALNGVHVTIMYDRIEMAAMSVAPSLARILGSALAHEVGHVLLSSEQHSQSGVMKAVWSRVDYQHLAAHQLEFLPHEAAILRDEVSRRAGLWEAASTTDRP